MLYVHSEEVIVYFKFRDLGYGVFACSIQLHVDRMNSPRSVSAAGASQEEVHS